VGVTRPCTGAWCTTFYQRYPTAPSLACKSLPGTRGAGHPRHCEREDHHRLTRFYSISTLLKWYRASSAASARGLWPDGAVVAPTAPSASARPSDTPSTHRSETRGHSQGPTPAPPDGPHVGPSPGYAPRHRSSAAAW